MDDGTLVYWIFGIAAAWCVFAVLGSYISGQKGRPASEGAMLGLFFGPLGCLVAAILPTVPRNPRDGT